MKDKKIILNKSIEVIELSLDKIKDSIYNDEVEVKDLVSALNASVRSFREINNEIQSEMSEDTESEKDLAKNYVPKLQELLGDFGIQ